MLAVNKVLLRRDGGCVAAFGFDNTKSDLFKLDSGHFHAV